MNDREDKPAESPLLLPGRLSEDVEIFEAARSYPNSAPYPIEGAKPFFEINTYRLSHRTYAGPMSEPVVREVFERGDAVGVLLYNEDTRKVIVVEQFRLPVIGKNSSGWVIETIAGIVRGGETPEATAIRETFEETGYRIENPEPIAEYFSSPGGASEKIFLFFKKVSNADKTGPEGGVGGEDIKIVQLGLDELTQRIHKREIVDPKLLIAAQYLRYGDVEISRTIDLRREVPSGRSTTSYAWTGNHQFQVGIKTGDILKVEGVDIWLNPMNRYMMLPRFFDKGRTAKVRWGAARKFENGEVAIDRLGIAIRLKMEGRSQAYPLEIIETEPGDLMVLGVRRLIHMPMFDVDSADRRITIEKKSIQSYLVRALYEAHVGNRSTSRLVSRLQERWHGHPEPCRSVLIPLVGTGTVGMSPREAADEVLGAIHTFLQEYHQETSLNRFYLLALYEDELGDCVETIESSANFQLVSATSGQGPSSRI